MNRKVTLAILYKFEAIINSHIELLFLNHKVDVTISCNENFDFRDIFCQSQ